MADKFLLQIVNGEGRKTERVEAERVREVFAVHPALIDSKFWQVSHIPTGWRLGLTKSRKYAIALVEHAVTDAGIDWKALSVDGSRKPHIRRKGKRFLANMKAEGIAL